MLLRHVSRDPIACIRVIDQPVFMSLIPTVFLLFHKIWILWRPFYGGGCCMCPRWLRVPFLFGCLFPINILYSKFSYKEEDVACVPEDSESPWCSIRGCRPIQGPTLHLIPCNPKISEDRHLIFLGALCELAYLFSALFHPNHTNLIVWQMPGPKLDVALSESGQPSEWPTCWCFEGFEEEKIPFLPPSLKYISASSPSHQISNKIFHSVWNWESTLLPNILRNYKFTARFINQAENLDFPFIRFRF